MDKEKKPFKKPHATSVRRDDGQKTFGQGKDKADKPYKKPYAGKLKGEGGERFKDYKNDKKDDSEDYIVGVNPVLEAMNGGRTINKIMIAKGKRTKSVHDIIVLAKTLKIIVQEVDKNKIEQIARHETHQGVVAYISPFPYATLDEALTSDKKDVLIVALDNLTDVQNFGSILRTCDAVGADFVIIPKRRSVQVNSTVAKTSAGAVEHVKIIRVDSMGNAIEKLKESGYWVMGADASGQETYYDADYSGKTVMIAGSEGEGMSKHVMRLCDKLVSIPMAGQVNSLNVSVAASLLLYEWKRQRDVANQ